MALPVNELADGESIVSGSRSKPPGCLWGTLSIRSARQLYGRKWRDMTIFDVFHRFDDSPLNRNEILYAFFNRREGDRWHNVRELVVNWLVFTRPERIGRISFGASKVMMIIISLRFGSCTFTRHADGQDGV